MRNRLFKRRYYLVLLVKFSHFIQNYDLLYDVIEGKVKIDNQCGVPTSTFYLLWSRIEYSIKVLSPH